jgi:hypothetical protein
MDQSLPGISFAANRTVVNQYNSDFATSDVRAGMGDLFAGKSTVTFKYTTMSQGHSVYWTEIWSRQGNAALDIRGRKVNAVVFELDHEGGGFHAKYRRYFDPATGVWVRNEFTNLGGGAAPFPVLGNTTYQVVSITIP